MNTEIQGDRGGATALFCLAEIMGGRDKPGHDERAFSSA
jgi:hypothetical protein